MKFLKTLWAIIIFIIALPLTIIRLVVRFARYLLGTTPDFTAMDGVAFEHYVSGWLAGQGCKQITTTKGSGDYGVDILARYGAKRYAVQCKCYRAKVGVSAVQEVLSGLSYYECDGGLVVASSSFTKNAEALAASGDIILIGYEELTDPNFRLFAPHYPLASWPAALRTLMGLGLIVLCLGTAILCYQAIPQGNPAWLLFILPAIYTGWGGAALLRGVNAQRMDQQKVDAEEELITIDNSEDADK